jgi:hypothetical protein
MSDPNTISWSESLLKWSDFQAEPNPAEFEDAYSSIKYRYTWTVTSEKFGNEIKFSIQNISIIPEFHRNLSWVRLTLSTDDLLKHQQGHFDLAELHKFEMINALKKLENKWYQTRGQNEEQRKQFAREDSGMLIATEMIKWDKFLIEKQKQYDFETDFGQLREKQSEYNSMFANLRKK